MLKTVRATAAESIPPERGRKKPEAPLFFK
jgi:hypothetical protein